MLNNLKQLKLIFTNYLLVRSAFQVMTETNIYLRSKGYKVRYNLFSGYLITYNNSSVEMVLNLSTLELRVTPIDKGLIKSYAYTHEYDSQKDRFNEKIVIT